VTCIYLPPHMTYTYFQELAETGQISLSQTSVSKLLGQVSTYHTLTLVGVYQYPYLYTCAEYLYLHT